MPACPSVTQGEEKVKRWEVNRSIAMQLDKEEEVGGDCEGPLMNHALQCGNLGTNSTFAV